MASIAGGPASQAARITERTRSMFRAILAENNITDTDNVILEQEMVMFFKLTRSHRIKLGRPGDFADCPVIIDKDDDGDDGVSDIVAKTVAPLLLQSPLSLSPTSPHSLSSSSLSSPLSSPPSSPLPPISIPSRMLLRDAADNVRSNTSKYAGMDGPNKRKRKRTSHRPRCEDARSRSLSIASSIESFTHASVNESRQPVETIGKTSLPQALQMAVEESVVPEGGSPSTSPPSVTDALKDGDSRYQITQSLEGGMSEILRFEDAVDVTTSVLVNAVKIRFQASKFSFKQITIRTTTNITEIRKYTEQSPLELPFEVAIQKIAKSGAGCVGIGLLKAWEEAFY